MPVPCRLASVRRALAKCGLKIKAGELTVIELPEADPGYTGDRRELSAGNVSSDAWQFLGLESVGGGAAPDEPDAAGLGRADFGG